MPDIFYNEVKSITQPPRLTAITKITTTTEVLVINPDGSRIPQRPEVKTVTIEKWTVRAIVDVEWLGIGEREFSFSTEADCATIKVGEKTALTGEEVKF